MHGTLPTGPAVEIRPLTGLASLTGELRDLAERACEPNVFYRPEFVAAATAMFGRDVCAALVWHGTPRRLIGFFPVRIERRRYGFGMPVAVGWTHPYGPLGTPLIDRDCANEAVAAWLDRLAADPGLPKLLLLPYLPSQGPTTHTFAAALARHGGQHADFAIHARALLAPGPARADYLQRAVPRKQLKERRRQRRRLADLGRVETTTVSDAPEMTSALADFFRLEAGGWKGRAGTAAANDPRLQAFITSAVTALAADGKANVTRLSVDGRAIAAAITLRSGDCAWGWKIAYDETFARASPGMQLLLDVTGTLLADDTIARADSCATPDHPMIDHVWRERLLLADRLMCVGGCGQTAFAIARALEAVRRGAVSSAKTLRNFVR